MSINAHFSNQHIESKCNTMSPKANGRVKTRPYNNVIYLLTRQRLP